jgi:hypothetical protein
MTRQTPLSVIEALIDRRIGAVPESPGAAGLDGQALT